jgi:hypothetical protein
MAEPQAAHINLVAGGEGGPEPEAQPGLQRPEPPLPAPPQELEKDMGGPAIPQVTADQMVGAHGGSIADQMRARFEGMASTEEFAVPGWELPNGEPGLIVEARAFGDRKAWQDQVSNEVFIVKSTHRLYFVDDQGNKTEIEGKWGKGLAAMLGVNVDRAADLVGMVISKPDPDNPGQRIPNVTGIFTLATQIVAWSQKGRKDAEETLGDS